MTNFWNLLPQPIVGLAPMDGVTDAAFRLITARHGRPDVCFTEFVAVERIVRGYDPDLTELDYSEEERPAIAQVFGSDPEAFYRVAHVVCELGFDGIDINMGCPAKSIAARGAGAGLIRTPDIARQILQRTREGVRDWAEGRRLEETGLPESAIAAVHRALDRHRSRYPGRIPEFPRRREIPVSVKTRLGYDKAIVEDWISVLRDEQPAAIALHGRTLTQRYRGRADWEAIGRAARLVRGSGTLLLGNGDLRSPAEVVARIRETGVHGVLLGRVSLGNPWIFRSAADIRSAAAESGPDPRHPEVAIEERFAVAREHARVFHDIKGARSYRSVRKYLSAYVRDFPRAALLRGRLAGVNTLADAESLLASPAAATPSGAALAEPHRF